MKNKIEDLRNYLFETIEGLLDPDKPLDIARAKAVAEVAQVAINSAKVECEFLGITKGRAGGTGFLESKPSLPALSETPAQQGTLTVMPRTGPKASL